MASSKSYSCLSAGLAVWEKLNSDETVMAIARKVFPVIATSGALLPYVCYRRTSLADTSVKGDVGADAINLTVDCYAADYDVSVRLAEAVRAALEGESFLYSDDDGGYLSVRSARLVDSTEDWVADAYVQSLVFEIRIN